MGWFKKKYDVLDLTERYKKQQAKMKEMKAEQEPASTTSTTTGGFGIFEMATPTPTTTTNSEYTDMSSGDDKRKKLAKRLMNITDKLEEISNQLYHLQQRIELLEKKNEIGY